MSTALLLIGLLVWWTKIWKRDPGWKCDFTNYLSAADQNQDSEPSSARRNTYRKGRYESSLCVRAFVQLSCSTLLSNELQMTFYSHNICWPLAAVTSLSSLHSVPPTVFQLFPFSPSRLELPASRIFLWLIYSFIRFSWRLVIVEDRRRTLSTRCEKQADFLLISRSTRGTFLSRVPPSPKWWFDFCNELMALCSQSRAVTTAAPIRYWWLNCVENPPRWFMIVMSSLIQLHRVKINIFLSVSFRRESNSCNYSGVSDSKIH